MPRDGSLTREKILDVANELILESGLSGASIERIVEKAKVTKGSFFYHFKDKDELIHDLVSRFAEQDRQHLEEALARVKILAGDDPLQQLLLFVGIFIEFFSTFKEPFPGCLYASYLYQKGIISDQSMQIVRDAMLNWRRAVGKLVEATMVKYPPKVPIKVDEVADFFTVTLEGAFIVSKTLRDSRILMAQLEQYRRYLQLLFAGADSAHAS